MAQLPQPFDSTKVEPQTEFIHLPAGEYEVVITATEMVETNDRAGQYLWIEMSVLNGSFKGRKVWDRLNLINKNSQAVEIAQRTLSSVCHAVGKLKINDSMELHNIPIRVKISVRIDESGRYDPQNIVKAYKSIADRSDQVNVGGTTPPWSQPQAEPAPQQAAPTSAPTPPWKKK